MKDGQGIGTHSGEQDWTVDERSAYRQPEHTIPPFIPEPPKRRRPLLVGIVAGAIGTFVVLGVIGYLVAPPESGVRLEEDFSSGEPQFTTDSDAFVDFSVVDGAYHILIKDRTRPQIARHVFDHTYPGLRVESTVRFRGPELYSEFSFFSVGCWAGPSAYVFALGYSEAGGVELGLGEMVSESEFRPLSDVITSDAVRPLNESNRLRIDCVGGGVEPTVVSGWVNGEPLLSVEVSDGFDSFTAVGFLVASDISGREFVVDDVIAAAEAPSPALSPVPPIEG
jgi:hypothetical protein